MTTFIRLEQYQTVEVSGEEAEKFLQGQLTCDVGALEIGQSTLAAHCDPKGKVVLLFRLIRTAQQQFYLLLRRDLTAFGLGQLKKYAVFSKVTFSEPQLQIVGVKGEKCGQFSARFEAAFAGRRILFDPERLPLFNAPPAQWDLWDIQDGYPILTAKTQNEFIPQALNLQCLEQAVSFRKGCYIGQETVARAKYRGVNKRAMYVLKARTDAIPEIGGAIEMRLESGWRKTGSILSAVSFDDVLWLQVIMNNDTDNQTVFRLPDTETVLELQALPYPLD